MVACERGISRFSCRRARGEKKKRDEKKRGEVATAFMGERPERKMAEEKYFPPRSRTVDMEERGGPGSSRAFEQRRTTIRTYRYALHYRNS